MVVAFTASKLQVFGANLARALIVQHSLGPMAPWMKGRRGEGTKGRKDHADPAPPPPSADLWVWRLHKGRLQWLFFGLSARIIVVIVQWTFIFHFGACCFFPGRVQPNRGETTMEKSS